MSLDTTVPRSRRALLGAAIGAAVATAASALGRPTPVRAGTDGDVLLGAENEAWSTTAIRAGDLLDNYTLLVLQAGENATALAVDGKVRFYGRSGRATVSAGTAYVDIDFRAGPDAPYYGLEGTPLCFANVMSYRPGVFVTMVRPNYPIKGKMRIYLNRAPASNTYVAWFVLN